MHTPKPDSAANRPVPGTGRVAWEHPQRAWDFREDGFPPTGAVIVHFSNRSDPLPYYLQRVIYREGLNYHAELIENERFATVAGAVLRANELADV